MNKRTVALAELAVLLASLIWGSGVAVVKDSLNHVSANWFVAIRTVPSAILMFLIFFRRIRMRWEDILLGLLCGFAIWLGTMLQTMGLKHTTASNVSFLAATYSAWTPLIYWLVTKKRPDLMQIVVCVMCMIGVGFVSLTDDFRLYGGDMLVLLSALVFAVQVVSTNVGTNRFSVDPIVLTSWQFLFCGLFSVAAALLWEAPLPAAKLVSDSSLLLPLMYSALLNGLAAFLLQNVGLKYARVSHAALLLATEAPFGCLFGILLLGERFSLRVGIGFAIIIGTIVFSEVMKNRKNAIEQ